MQATLDQVKALVDDVRDKTGTIITKLHETKAQVDTTKALLEEAIKNAANPAALAAVKDELQGVDDSLTAAISTAQAPPPTTTP